MKGTVEVSELQLTNQKPLFETWPLAANPAASGLYCSNQTAACYWTVLIDSELQHGSSLQLKKFDATKPLRDCNYLSFIDIKGLKSAYLRRKYFNILIDLSEPVTSRFQTLLTCGPPHGRAVFFVHLHGSLFGNVLTLQSWQRSTSFW